jgi:hypothetical protein
MKAFGKTGKCSYCLTDGTGVLLSNGNRYCNEPTKYTMAHDDDGNSFRDYDYLCPKHRAVVDAMPEGDEE